MFKQKIITATCVLFCSLSNAQTITTIAGGGTSGYGTIGPAITATFNGIGGLVFDKAGNLYLAETYGNRIRKIDVSGIVTTFAGSSSAGFSGDGGQANLAVLHSPMGIAIDSLGDVTFSDFANSRVRKINTLGIIKTIVGNGSFGYVGDGGQATSARLGYPQGITYDNYGNLYIADNSGNTVRSVNTSSIINETAGGGTCSSNYCGDGGLAIDARMSGPSNIAFDPISGNLYIVDGGNACIRVVDNLGVITTYAGKGTINNISYSGPAISVKLGIPMALAIDGAGNLFISDGGNHCIRMVNTNGIISTIAGNGSTYYSGDGGLAINAGLGGPGGITFDAAGNLYFADIGNTPLGSTGAIIRKIDHVGVTGIKENNFGEQNVTIYPNPNDGRFTVNIDKHVRCLIYNTNGEIVLEKVVSKNNLVDLSNLGNGIYTLSFICNDAVINKRVTIIK